MSHYSTLIYETTRSTYFSATIPPRTFVTREEVDAAQEVQDKGIRREFKTVHEKLDILRSGQEKLQSDVEDLRSSYGLLHDDVKDLRSSHRLLHDDVKDLRSSHEKLQSDVKDLKALFFNQAAYKAWDTILPQSVDGGYPKNFPDKVIKFWHLQRPKNHGRLMSLIRFYKLDESLYYYYSEETHSFMSEEDVKSQEEQTEQELVAKPTERLSDSTLQTLIKEQPLFVLRVLADWLRLDFAAIQSRMPEVSASPPSVAQKRAVVETDDRSVDEQKRVKVSTPPEQKSPIHARFDPNNSFTRALIRDLEEAIQQSPESSEGHITWDRGSKNLLHRVPRRKITPPCSSPLPEGSSEGKLTSTLRLSGQSKETSAGEKEGKPP